MLSLHCCAIPKVGGVPTKGPTRSGWNKAKSADNPDGYTSEQSEVQHWIDAGWNVGLCHVPSGTVSLDIDDMPMCLMIFEEMGIPIVRWIDDSESVQIFSGKAGKGKLIYKIPEGFNPPSSVKLNFGKGKDAKSIFEIRHGSKDGTTLQDVIPPSIHPDTLRPYTMQGRLEDAPDLPGELMSVWANWDTWKKCFQQYDPSFVETAPPEK